MIHYENNDNPYIERKSQISIWENKAEEIIIFSECIKAKALEIMVYGIREKDALHLACAIKSDPDYFITTDKKLLNIAV